jgi:hypothetical protein
MELCIAEREGGCDVCIGLVWPRLNSVVPTAPRLELHIASGSFYVVSPRFYSGSAAVLHMRPLATRAALLRPAKATAIPAQRALVLVPSLVPRLPRCRFSSTQAPATEKLSPRWLSDIRARIGKCIMFGINDAQTSEAGSILQEVSCDWRELLAGSEGFLTGQEYRGLYRQEVVWGEMVGECLRE